MFFGLATFFFQLVEEAFDGFGSSVQWKTSSNLRAQLTFHGLHATDNVDLLTTLLTRPAVFCPKLFCQLRTRLVMSFGNLFGQDGRSYLQTAFRMRRSD